MRSSRYNQINNVDKNTRVKKQSNLWVSGFIVLVIILIFSLQTATTSNALSTSITENAMHLVNLLKGTDNVEYTSAEIARINNIVRNMAHSVLYFVVTLVIMLFWYRKSGILRKSAVMSGISVFGIAFLDETIQSFVPGRGAEVMDLMSDSMGGVLAIICFGILVLVIRAVRAWWLGEI